MDLFETLKFAAEANVTISFSPSSQGLVLHVRDRKGNHIDSLISNETDLINDIQSALISLGYLKDD